MAFSTKDITASTGSGKISKTMKPGNHTAKILKLSLQRQKSNPENVYLLLHLEGEDQGADFEGFLYDPEKPELGRAKGQVARVKFSQFPYTNGETKNGRKKNVVFDLASDIVRLAEALNVREELDQIEGDEKNLDKYVEDVSKVFNNGKYLYFCIGGSAYIKNDGRKDYSLHLPKYSREYLGFEPVGSTPSRVAKFEFDRFVEDKTGVSETENKEEAVVEWVAEKSAPWTPTEFEL